MLTYQICNKIAVEKDKSVTIEEIVSGDSKLLLTIPLHGMRDGDTLFFIRQIGESTATFYQSKTVTVIDKNTLSIEPFYDISYTIQDNGINTVEYENTITIGKATYLEFNLNEQHFFVKNRENDTVIDRINDSSTISTNRLRTCRRSNEKVIYNDVYIHDAIGSKLSLSGDGYYYYTSLGGNENISADTYYYDEDGNEQALGKCLIPFGGNTDDRTRMLWNYVEGIHDDLLNYILNIGSGFVIHVRDTRFITTGLSLQEGTTVIKGERYIRLSLPIESTFGTSVRREAYDNDNLVNSEVESSVPSIIDYEKQMFTPICYSNDHLWEISKLTFNVHMLRRDENGSIINLSKAEDGSLVDTDDNGIPYLNMSSGQSKWYISSDLIYPVDGEESQYDYSLGFTEDDVFYQKKKVTKSFLRLMVYDSKNIGNQSLLYYSTIFLDGGQLFSKYMKKKSGADIRIDSTFSCSNKYNMQACSEGFYLYLFPDTIKHATGETLYLKAEFNNAKYGQTIPLVFTHRNGYIKLDTSGGSMYTDVKQELEDMYTEIVVKYNTDLSRYEWYFPSINDKTPRFDTDEKEIVVTLFEPITNGYEDNDINVDDIEYIEPSEEEKEHGDLIYEGSTNGIDGSTIKTDDNIVTTTLRIINNWNSTTENYYSVETFEMGDIGTFYVYGTDGDLETTIKYSSATQYIKVNFGYHIDHRIKGSDGKKLKIRIYSYDGSKTFYESEWMSLNTGNYPNISTSFPINVNDSSNFYKPSGSANKVLQFSIYAQID